MGPTKGSSAVLPSDYLPLKWILSETGSIPRLINGTVEDIDPRLLVYTLAMTAVRTTLEYRHGAMTARGYYLAINFEELCAIFDAVGSPYEKTNRQTRIRVGFQPWWMWLLKQGMIPDTKTLPFPPNNTNTRLLSNLAKVAEKLISGGEKEFYEYVERLNNFQVVVPPINVKFPKAPTRPEGSHQLTDADWERYKNMVTYCLVEAYMGKIDKHTLAKIGFTRRTAEKRMGDLHTGNSHLKVYMEIPSRYVTEQHLHRLLTDSRIKIKTIKNNERESEFFLFSHAKDTFDHVARTYSLPIPDLSSIIKNQHEAKREP